MQRPDSAEQRGQVRRALCTGLHPHGRKGTGHGLRGPGPGDTCMRQEQPSMWIRGGPVLGSRSPRLEQKSAGGTRWGAGGSCTSPWRCAPGLGRSAWVSLSLQATGHAQWREGGPVAPGSLPG